MRAQPPLPCYMHLTPLGATPMYAAKSVTSLIPPSPSLRCPARQWFTRRLSGDGCDQVQSSNEFLAWKEFIFMGRAAFPDEHFKITAGEADVLPENFGNVNTICACLRAREPGRQEAAHA